MCEVTKFSVRFYCLGVRLSFISFFFQFLRKIITSERQINWALLTMKLNRQLCCSGRSWIRHANTINPRCTRSAMWLFCHWIINFHKKKHVSRAELPYQFIIYLWRCRIDLSSDPDIFHATSSSERWNSASLDNIMIGKRVKSHCRRGDASTFEWNKYWRNVKRCQQFWYQLKLLGEFLMRIIM